MCECILGSGGEVCQPRGLHPHPDQTAAIMEAADHPCLAPTAPKDQGHSPQPKVSETGEQVYCLKGNKPKLPLPGSGFKVEPSQI